MAIFIFFEEKVIYINDDLKSINPPLIDQVAFLNIHHHWDFRAFLLKLLDPSIKQIQIGGDTADNILTLLMSHFAVITAAGGIVTDEQNRLLFIFRRGKWDLPKGKIEADETIAEGAKREIEEETGLKAIFLQEKITVTYHLYTMHNEWVLKPSHWFHFIANNTEGLTPQTAEDITDLRWFAANELDIPKANTFENIIKVLEAFLK